MNIATYKSSKSSGRNIATIVSSRVSKKYKNQVVRYRSGSIMLLKDPRYLEKVMALFSRREVVSSEGLVIYTTFTYSKR